MRNSPLRAFASPIKEGEKQRTPPAKPKKENLTQELLNINIKKASKKKTIKQKRKEDWDLN